MNFSDFINRKSGELTRMLLVFGLALVFLSLVYLPTFLYPYLLTDETWIVRIHSLTWASAMGRPLFSALSWVLAKINAIYGLGVVHALRASAIVGLALSVYFLMRWLERWKHDRWSSFGFALAAMTLPAYQIVVADGTQLAFAILFAILATLVFHRGFERRSLVLFACSAMLLGAALLIYQQQALIAFALLAVPLLQCPGERRVQLLVICGGTFATTISALYFVAWRIAYRIFWPDRIDTRYGPDAVSFPTLDQIIGFIDIRFSQVANLWRIHGTPTLSWVVAIVSVLMVVKICRDIRIGRFAALLSYAILAGLIIASDSFALIAHAYPSYITVTALSLLIFYWAFAGAMTFLGTRAAAAVCSLAIFGGIFAFITVKNEIAIPNWRHSQDIRAAILAHPEAVNFHFNGLDSGLGYQEFGWRNAATDVYLYQNIHNIADDLVLKKEDIVKAAQKDVFFHFWHAAMRVARFPSLRAAARLGDHFPKLSIVEKCSIAK